MSTEARFRIEYDWKKKKKQTNKEEAERRSKRILAWLYPLQLNNQYSQLSLQQNPSGRWFVSGIARVRNTGSRSQSNLYR